MDFTITYGTFFLFIFGILFVLIVRLLCKKDVIGEQIGIIDKFMLVSMFIHIIWAFIVDLLSNTGYQFLVWDDESYHSVTMLSYAPVTGNLYNNILWVLYYIFGRTTVTGRLTNLFFSVATIFPLATIEKRLNHETKYAATKFYAYSPFMVFISFFEIKDIILMFFYISSYAIVKKLQKKASISYLALLILICVVNEQIRNGTGVLPIAVLILTRLHGVGKTMLQRKFVKVVSIVIVLAVGVYVGQEYFQFGILRLDKYSRWIQTQFSSNSIYNNLVITQIGDLWKVPICFLLYAIQPFDMYINMRYLSDFGLIAKAVDVPILFFSILFLPRYTNKEKMFSLFFWVFYMFTSCVNLTNARQGFFLYPIMYLIFFDSFLFFESHEENVDGSLIYRNGHIWKLAVEGLYIVWILFVLYRLVH